MNDKYPASNRYFLNKRAHLFTSIITFLLIPSLSFASKLLDHNSQTTDLENTPFIVGNAYRPGNAWIDAVAIGDIDGDGDKEIIAASGFNFDEENDFSIFIFHPVNGELGIPIRYSYEATASRVSLEVVDLDHNDIDEIIVGNNNGLTIFHQNGLGQLVKLLEPSASINTLSSMDINLDGNLDLIGLPWNAPAYQFFGNGSFASGNIIQFQSPLPTIAGGYNAQAIGDLNSDGLSDLIVASGQGGNGDFTIHHHNGIDGFHPFQTYFLPDGGPRGIAVGDINGDNKDDIVLSRGYNSPTHLWVYVQNESGEWSNPIKLPSHDIPETLDIADLDLNGTDDIVVLHGGWRTMGVYLNEGDTLGEEIRVRIPYAAHYYPEGLAIGDMDGDNCPETIVIAVHDSGVVPIHSTLCDDIQPIPEPTQGEYRDTVYNTPVKYPFNIAGGETLFQLDFAGKQVDLDIKLYNPQGVLVASSETQQNREIIQYDAGDSRGVYSVEIINNSANKRKTGFRLKYEARLID